MKLKQLAEEKFRAICRKHVLKKVRNIALTLKVVRDRYSTTVQSQLRGFLAKKRLAERRQEELMKNSAT